MKQKKTQAEVIADLKRELAYAQKCGRDKHFLIEEIRPRMRLLEREKQNLVEGPDGLNSYKHRCAMYLAHIRDIDQKTKELQKRLDKHIARAGRRKPVLRKRPGRSFFLIQHTSDGGLEIKPYLSETEARKELHGRCLTEGCRIVEFVEKTGNR